MFPIMSQASQKTVKLLIYDISPGAGDKTIQRKLIQQYIEHLYTRDKQHAERSVSLPVFDVREADVNDDKHREPE